MLFHCLAKVSESMSYSLGSRVHSESHIKALQNQGHLFAFELELFYQPFQKYNHSFFFLLLGVQSMTSAKAQADVGKCCSLYN